MSEILLLIFIGFIIWLWRDSTQTKELAVSASSKACKQINAQFLDQTVVLSRLRLCRTMSGTMALCRVHVFDLTLDREVRREGVISMKGQVILDLVLDVDHATKLQ